MAQLHAFSPQSAPVRVRRPHLGALTGLRFFAALLVVLHHFWKALEPSLAGSPAWLVEPLGRLAANGFVGVSLFFILSGFILTYTYDRPGETLDKRRFWVARVARIYPAYLFSLLVALPDMITDASVLLAKHGTTHGLLDAAGKAGLVLTLLQAWSPGGAQFWNAPAWSLSAEAFFYALFPFLLAAPLFRKPAPRQAAVTMALLWLLTLGLGVTLLAVRLTHPHLDIYAIVGMAPLFRLPEFMIGILLARRFMAGAGRSEWATWGSVGAIAGFWALNALVGFPDELAIPLNLPLGILLIASLAHGLGPVARLLSGAGMTLMGEASYSLYLLHVPIGHRFLEQTGGRFNPLTFGAYLVVTLLASVLLFQHFENPMRLRLRRMLAPKGYTASEGFKG